MRNRISDLNDYLFEALDAISNDDLDEEELTKELKRAKTVSEISKQIVEVGRLQLDAARTALEYGSDRSGTILPAMLTYDRK